MLNWIGSLARAYTIMVEESDDIAFKIQAILAVSLTTTLMAQFFIYQKKTEYENSIILSKRETTFRLSSNNMQTSRTSKAKNRLLLSIEILTE